MSVLEELRKLYDETAERAIADGVGLAEVDDVALAAVLKRHEQMMRAKVAEEIQREADEHSNGRRSSWDRGMTRAAEIARGDSDA